MRDKLIHRSTLSASLFLVLSLAGSGEPDVCSSWLEFYHLKREEFHPYGLDRSIPMNWTDYSLSDPDAALFRQFFIHSPDSSYYIDLDSYSLELERSGDALISYGSEVDRKVQLIDRNGRHSTTLLFCGSDSYPEAAYWTDPGSVDILGFSRSNTDALFPTIWKIDLTKKLMSEYRGQKSMGKMPHSYAEEVRLKTVDFKR